VNIELLFQKGINGRIQAERVSRWAGDSEAAIQVEATRALAQEVHLGPTERK
jgi:hypothetical protein